jgi:thiol:disulfide interchange protein DsbD
MNSQHRGIVKIPKLLLLLSLFLSAVVSVMAQDDSNPVVWKLSAKAVTVPVKPGDKFTVELKSVIAEGWHVYSITQPPGGPTTTVINMPVGQPFEMTGSIRADKLEKMMDSNFNMMTELYEGSAAFQIPVAVMPFAQPGTHDLVVKVLFQACNETICMPPTTVAKKAATASPKKK